MTQTLESWVEPAQGRATGTGQALHKEQTWVQGERSARHRVTRSGDNRSQLSACWSDTSSSESGLEVEGTGPRGTGVIQ